MTDPIGKWYADRARECKELYEELREAKEMGASPDVIHSIKQRIDAAEYVGD